MCVCSCITITMVCVCVSIAVHERDYALEPTSHETAGVEFTPFWFPLLSAFPHTRRVCTQQSVHVIRELFAVALQLASFQTVPAQPLIKLKKKHVLSYTVRKVPPLPSLSSSSIRQEGHNGL